MDGLFKCNKALMESDSLRLVVTGSVATLTRNGPDALNAVGLTMDTELGEMFAPSDFQFQRSGLWFLL
jgi:hypothetical protein